MTETPAVPPIPKARLLVVDDEPNVRAALKRSLNLLGYVADEAASGLQALHVLENTPYDLMILDLRMPGLDGVEVMQRARQIHPDLLIIVLTGHATLDSAIAAVRSQAVDYMLKPASLHDIGAAVAAALRERAKALRRQHLLEVMDQTLDALRESEAPAPRAEMLERFVTCGGITLDAEERLVVVREQDSAHSHTTQLTENETALLAYLMSRPAQVLSTRELARGALGYDLSDQEADSIVRPHIFRLRRKLEPEPGARKLIRTVRGRGYVLEP
jgi:DNA-binding response OmpR family regulator